MDLEFWTLEYLPRYSVWPKKKKKTCRECLKMLFSQALVPLSARHLNLSASHFHQRTMASFSRTVHSTVVKLHPFCLQKVSLKDKNLSLSIRE